MNNFTLESRPKVFFGKGQIENLKNESIAYKNILLVYGQKSIKKNGIYDEIINQLSTKNIFELSNVTPNPRLSDVKKGIKICKENDIELILAVGGGSVIDCAKAISIGAKSTYDIWDIIVDKKEIIDAIPLATIPTMIATGSETNDIFVVYNDEINLKRSLKTKFTYPKFSIMDPTYTTTINKRHTVNGIVDTLSHLLEQYINNGANEIIDSQIVTLFKDMLNVGEKLVQDLNNYELRAKHMYIAMAGYNGDYRTILGGDWACHGMDYGLASEFDNYHGEGLSIITPNWMKYILSSKKDSTKLQKILEEVFEKEDSLLNVEKFENYLIKIGAPVKYNQVKGKDIKLTEKVLDKMIQKSQFTKPLGGTYPLTEEEIKQIYLMGE